MTDAKDGIAVAGTLIADVFYEIDTYPAQGLLTNIRDMSFNIGGSGNLILDLAKLDDGLPVKVCAIVGNDSSGDLLMETLANYPNVDTESITREGSSSVTHVMNAKDTKQRTFFFHPAASDIFDETYIDWEKIDARIFHLEYLLLMKKVDAPDTEYGTHGARILHDAKQRGMLTSVDIVSEQSDRARTVVTAALAYTDICTVNELEAEAITGIAVAKNGSWDKERVQEAMHALKNMGVGKWIVIHTPEGGYGYDCQADTLKYVPSLCLPDGYIKGSNGAGDAYCSGILYGAYQGMELEEAMELATACAACSLSENNGTDGMRPCSQVWKLREQLK